MPMLKSTHDEFVEFKAVMGQINAGRLQEGPAKRDKSKGRAIPK